MKVLWFTNTPSLYEQGKHHYHGGGWIESLERLITEEDDIDLAIAFFHAVDSKKITRNNTTYYPIKRVAGRRRPLLQLLNNWNGTLSDEGFYTAFIEVVEDFQPNVIQVFGTEGPFARIQEFTNVPVVIHLQGLINPYLNAYFPVGNSKLDFLMNSQFLLKNILFSSPTFAVKRFTKQAEREQKILQKARYVMGRTHWDYMLAKLYNPEVYYYHVDEVLRPNFYDIENTILNTGKKTLSILSTLSPTIYKGLDVVLRTAKQLKAFNRFEFTWDIAGITDDDPLLQHFEKKERISHKLLGIRCVGRKSPLELIEMMRNVDVFVHPSYIDNSPNSVCEAQMLGLPVIACDVGGLSSLIKHNETGLLVPANSVFETVHCLYKLAEDKSYASRIGRQAATHARHRHNTDKIIRELKSVYHTITGS